MPQIENQKSKISVPLCALCGSPPRHSLQHPHHHSNTTITIITSIKTYSTPQTPNPPKSAQKWLLRAKQWLFSAQKWPKTAFSTPKTPKSPQKPYFTPIPRPPKNTPKIVITPASAKIYDFATTLFSRPTAPVIALNQPANPAMLPPLKRSRHGTRKSFQSHHRSQGADEKHPRLALTSLHVSPK
jgi:hypothetical protein